MRLRADAARRIGDRRGGEQRLRIGMHDLPRQITRLRELDDLAEIHHRDAVGDAAHEREVVGDEHVGQAELALQPAQQVDDLRLDRYVERRHRLVAHHDAPARTASARAIATRWRCPPESSCG